MIFNRMFNLCLFTACLNLQSNLSNSENLIRSRRLSVKEQLQSTTTTVRSLTHDEFRTTMLRGIRESLKRNRMMRMINKHILQPGRKEICYETVGCFDLPRKHLPIMKPPESPLTLNTKFYLFRRDINFSAPALLEYENITTVVESKFNPNKTSKFLIHGYMSTWDEVGALMAVEAYLKIDDYNVVLVDWANGAKGPNYRTAAANTEVVGRQVGVLLLSMLKLGADPNHIHLLGFSLGAHIAGVASEVLKLKGSLIGRITALDPASPLFKHHLLRDQSKKLDITDARFVDVVHTDGSPIWTDGFGLLEPIGHVDFFPNGGREQSGCNDGRGSVVVAQFEPLNRDLACSHIRAWQYYLESLLTKAYNPENGCKFIAYPCATGLVGFTYGRCFPVNLFNNNNKTLVLDSNYRSDFGYLGEDVKGYGPMYLVTQNHKPFCGTQLQTVIRVSQKTQQTRGILQLQVKYDNNHTTNFQIKCELLDIIPVGHNMYGLSAAAYNSLNTNITKMTANLSYQSLAFQSPHNVTISPKLFLDKIQVRDMFGNSWQFCGLETEVVDKHGEFFETLTVELNKEIC